MVAVYGVAAEAEATEATEAEVGAAVYAVAEVEVGAAVYGVAVAEAEVAVYGVVVEAAVYGEGVGAVHDAAAVWGRESAASGNAADAIPPNRAARRPVHLRPCFLKRRPPGRLARSTSCSRSRRPPFPDCLRRLHHSR